MGELVLWKILQPSSKKYLFPLSKSKVDDIYMKKMKLFHHFRMNWHDVSLQIYFLKPPHTDY